MSRASRLCISAMLAITWLGGCDKDESATDGQLAAPTDLESVLFGRGGECAEHADCPAGVCGDGFCVTLENANQAWMEPLIAARVQAALAAHPSLVDALLTQAQRFEESDPFVRGRFASMLGLLGDPRFKPLLERWAKSAIERVRVRAHLALARLGEPASLGEGGDYLAHRSEGVALDAADALGGYFGGENAKVAVQYLLAYLQDERYRIRQRCVRMLGISGSENPKVHAALRALLEDEGEGYLRNDLRRALTRLGAK